MGLSLIFLGDLALAEDYFLKALRYLPNHADTLHWIAYINFKKGQLSTAEDYYLSSLKSQSRSQTSINGCIHFFIEQGLNGEEINVFLNKNGVQLKENENFYLNNSKLIKTLNIKLSLTKLKKDCKRISKLYFKK